MGVFRLQSVKNPIYYIPYSLIHSMKYFLGLLGVGLGILLVVKTEWLIQNFGTSTWAETHMGTSGGTRLMYKLIGIIIIFLSFMAMTGLLGGFILAIFGGIFGAGLQ